MTKEKFKDVLFTHVNLDPYRKATYEKFFEEEDDITAKNFEQKYCEWKEANSEKIKKIYEKVRKEELGRKDALIEIGKAAIQNKDYTARNEIRFGLAVVRCNKTGLRGIVTTEGEEVLPCIFDSINIHIDGYIETFFKGVKFNFGIVYREKGDKYDGRHGIIYYGKSGAIRLNIDADEQPEDVTKELAVLLGLELKSKKHRD